MDLHKHCYNCYRRFCNDPLALGCKAISCKFECGAVFHSCKLEDHLNICPNNVVSCINSEYGCTFKLRRNCINEHLGICPASTVICTMEWNRKPLELKNTIQMKDFNPNANIYNQLEVALALRDQRVLLEAMTPPKMFSKLCTCDESTKHFRVSLSSSKLKPVNASTEVEDKQLTNNDESNIHAYEQKKITQCTILSNSLNNSNDTIPSEDVIDIHLTKPIRKPLLKSKFTLMPKREFKNESCDTSDLAIETLNMNWLNPGVNIFGFDLITRMFEMLGAYERRETVSSSLHGEGIKCTFSDARLCSFRQVATQTRPFFEVYKHVGRVGNALQEVFERTLDSYLQSSVHNPLLYKTLALNQVMECLPRYERKSRSIYSFMCNTLLRRDQFQSHFQNVHCEIHSHLNGWLEEKCPYAQYGCTFSQYRFLPHSGSSELLFDNARSCLTVKTNSGIAPQQSVAEESEWSYLLSLPWEILEFLLGYLDSYSIGQLSQTCTFLKSLCISYLKERGIVSLNWKKFKRIDGNVTWQVVGETWLFSNSFTEIKKWSCSQQPNMCCHIAKCSIASLYKREYAEDTRLHVMKCLP